MMKTRSFTNRFLRMRPTIAVAEQDTSSGSENLTIPCRTNRKTCSGRSSRQSGTGSRLNLSRSSHQEKKKARTPVSASATIVSNAEMTSMCTPHNDRPLLAKTPTNPIADNTARNEGGDRKGFRNNRKLSLRHTVRRKLQFQQKENTKIAKSGQAVSFPRTLNGRRRKGRSVLSDKLAQTLLKNVCQELDDAMSKKNALGQYNKVADLDDAPTRENGQRQSILD